MQIWIQLPSLQVCAYFFDENRTQTDADEVDEFGNCVSGFGPTFPEMYSRAEDLINVENSFIIVHTISLHAYKN